ncbi:MAG: DUF1579 domain-containing protein [Rhodothermaceae bacterium]
MRLVKVLFILLVFTFTLVTAQDKDAQMTAEQKAWMEYAMPGEMHKMMAEKVGKWKTYTEMWMQPGTEAMKSEGTVEYKMILGGRYLKAWYTGTSMGMPFDGMSIEAYDNAKKEFITTWIDSFGTGITVATSKYHKDKNMMKGTGTMVDPVTGKDIVYKTVVKMESKDKGVFDMYMTMPDGKDFLSMRMTYIREK